MPPADVRKWNSRACKRHVRGDWISAQDVCISPSALTPGCVAIGLRGVVIASWPGIVQSPLLRGRGRVEIAGGSRSCGGEQIRWRGWQGLKRRLRSDQLVLPHSANSRCRCSRRRSPVRGRQPFPEKALQYQVLRELGTAYVLHRVDDGKVPDQASRSKCRNVAVRPVWEGHRSV